MGKIKFYLDENIRASDRIPMIIAIALKSPNYLFSPQCWGLGG